MLNPASSGLSDDTKTFINSHVTKQEIIDYLTKTGIDALSFTHAKFLAVNGKVLMTGGANNSGYGIHTFSTFAM